MTAWSVLRFAHAAMAQTASHPRGPRASAASGANSRPREWSGWQAKGRGRALLVRFNKEGLPVTPHVQEEKRDERCADLDFDGVIASPEEAFNFEALLDQLNQLMTLLAYRPADLANKHLANITVN